MKKILKKPAQIIHIGTNGMDYVKIIIEDDLPLREIVRQVMLSKKIEFSDTFNGFFISKYTSQDIYNILTITGRNIDWRISGGLLEKIKYLIPLSPEGLSWSPMELVKGLGLRPTPSQFSCLRGLLERNLKSFILFGELSSGKKLPALIAAKVWQREFGKLTIMCSSTKFYYWEKYIKDYFPDIEFEIIDFNKMPKNPEVVIFDDIHLMARTPKRKAMLKSVVKKAKKNIGIIPFDTSDIPESVFEILQLVGLPVVKKLYVKGVTTVDSLCESLPILRGSLINLKLEKKENRSVTVPLHLDKNLALNNPDVSLDNLNNELEKLSHAKIPHLKKYISDLTTNPSINNILIYSSFLNVINSVCSKISGSNILNDTFSNKGHISLTANKSIFDISLSSFDVVIILDPFLNALDQGKVDKNHDLKIIRFEFTDGIDQIARREIKYVSVNRNLEKIKKILSLT